MIKHSDNYQCIYCLESLPGCAFNKEHVLPDAFGKFEGALKLIDKEVCKDCNDYYGKYTDRILGRDSLEALYRLQHGIKPFKEAGDLPYERLILTVPEGYGDWEGVRVEISPDSESHPMTVRKPAQVGFFLRSSGKYKYFSIFEMDREASELHERCG